MSARLALVPLDERPVCLRLPAMIAAVAGASVDVPPLPLRPRIRRPGNAEGLAGWLSAAARTADAAVVSLEGLGLGGLVPSRIGSEPVSDVLHRWAVLRDVAAPVHAAVVVPRAPAGSDSFEEPTYWAEHGPALHGLSVGEPAPGVPEVVRRDWLRRRLRQHILALAAVGLAADGVLETLVVGIDDAGPGSLSAADAAALDRWTRPLQLPGVLVLPGADEAGAVLVARALLGLTGGPPPRVRIACAVDGGLDRVAAYETAPVGDTVRGQLRAAGARVVESGPADAVLVVHAPDGAGDWAIAPPATTDAAAAAATAGLVERELGVATAVGVADVAQPNGADPALVAALADRDLLGRLAAFAGWNTAGNAAGTAVAHLVAGLAGARAGTADPLASTALLAHRIVEDWAWMSCERPRLRALLGADPTRHEAVAVDRPELAGLEAALDAHLRRLPALSRWRVAAGSVRLPWQRTFEIDLEVVSR